MDSHQIGWAIVFIPILVLYSLIEIRRGWRILRYRELTLNPTLRMRVWLLRSLKGNEAADRYERSILENATEMTLNALYGIAGGIFLLIACFFWVLIYFRLKY